MCRYHFTGYLLLSGLSIFQGTQVCAQNIFSDGTTTISEILEENISSRDEESDPTALADELYHFLDHPINLNTASDEELRKLLVLTEFQIFALRDYINENGQLLSVYELQLVYGFDRQLINRLVPFICISQKETSGTGNSKSKRYINQTLVFQAGFEGEKKTGFIPDSTGTTPFMGTNRSMQLRYQAELGRFNFGFTLDQDAGETFTSDNKRFSPDFYSVFLDYTGQKFIKKILVGDFKVSFGQGLVLGGYGTRKGSQVLISPGTSGIKKYHSCSEADFFRGTACSLNWKNLNLFLFTSSVKTDASLHEMPSDSTLQPYFNSLDATGLHRTPAELEKKDAVVCTSLGGHLEILLNKAVWGITYLNEAFSHEWVRNITAYTTEMFPAKKRLQNLAGDFKISLGKISAFGEIASDCKVRMAVSGGILAELHPLVRLSMVYRNYQPEYLGMRSSGFGEGQGTKNERGYYLGLQFYPWKYLQVELYSDHYRFPFLRYNSTNPFSGSDYLLNLTFFPSREFTVTMRFRHEITQTRATESTPVIDLMQNAIKSGYRLDFNYELNRNFRFRSRLEFSRYNTAEEKLQVGYYSGHDIGFISSSHRYNIWMRYAIYDIPGWESRIYAYENNVQYSFSIPAFNGRGTRFILMAKTEIIPGFELTARYALSQFPGIKKWGNGNDQLKDIKDSLLTLQLKIRI